MKCNDCESRELGACLELEKEGLIFLCHLCWYERHEHEFTMIICDEDDIREGEP